MPLHKDAVQAPESPPLWIHHKRFDRKVSRIAQRMMLSWKVGPQSENRIGESATKVCSADDGNGSSETNAQCLTNISKKNADISADA